MNALFSGLSDSLLLETNGTPQCADCGSPARVQNGLCAACLLQSAIELGGEPLDESWLELLAQTQLRDSDWYFGNYHILEEVGRGGMGVIYRARQRHSRRIVALKRVLSYHSESRETLERFRREAEAAASLDHPNILPIYEVGEADGLPFFTMKLATGGSLLQAAPLLRKDARECVRLLMKVTRAVAYAHGEGILHRDLKPGNILLDARGEPLVSDFGLAKWLDRNTDLTRTLTVFGTPGYIAPEQAHTAAGQLTPAADIYSLGAILFDLLTGRTPFLGEHAFAVIKQAEEKPAPKLRALIKSADRDLETICAKCLERDPRLRYRSAVDLTDDLQRWLEGRPIVARPVLPPVKLWRWSKRNPVVSGAIIVAVILVIAAAGWNVENRRMRAAIYNDAVDAHSLVILPFLDLDEGSPEMKLTQVLATSLQERLHNMGPSRVTMAKTLPARCTGAGNQVEVRSAALVAPSKFALAGTWRHTSKGWTVSLHLLLAEDASSLGDWIFQVGESPGFGGLPLPTALYALMNNPTAHVLATDPVLENERARAYMIAGRDLLNHRTLADEERAVTCFEAAAREVPKSISALSSLSVACIARSMISASPDYERRANAAVEAAVAINPQDPAANRALCVVATHRCDYPRALESGYRALEFGDKSERVFGQLGYVCRMVGRPDRAMRWYALAKRSQEQPADYESLIGDCWADVGRDDLAERAYKAAATFEPARPDGVSGLCRVKLSQGDFAAARELCRSEITKFAEPRDLLQMSGEVEFFARDFAAAEPFYDKLIAADPLGAGNDGYGALDYRSALAGIRLAQDRGAEARKLLQNVIADENARLSEVPQNPAAFYRRAAAEAMLGEHDKALSDLRSAVSNGWLDDRLLRLDPRFDSISQTSEFAQIADELTARIAVLRDNLTEMLNQNTE